MNISPNLFVEFPPIIQPLISNGFIMGVFISIIIEKIVNWDKFAEIEILKKSA